MTSFFADTTAYVSNRPETVFALLATSRPFMNSSIVPVILSSSSSSSSDDSSSRSSSTWESLTYHPTEKFKLENFLKLFSEFSDTMQFTRSITFDTRLPPDKLFTNNVLKHLIKNRRYFTTTIQHLDFSSTNCIEEVCCCCCSASDDDDENSGEKMFFRNLHSITIPCDFFSSSPRLSNHHLELICSHFPRLEELDLSGQVAVTDSGIKHISTLSRLKSLNLSSLSLIRELPFLKNLKFLRKLNLERCANLRESDAFSFVDDSDNDDCQNDAPVLLSLEELNFQKCGNDSSSSHIALKQFQHHAPNLASLSCYKVTALEGYSAISCMSKLRVLKLAFAKDLDHSGIKLLMTNLKHLEDLSIENCLTVDEEGLRMISETSSPIKSLQLVQCYNINDAGFGSLLKSMKKLEKLEISKMQRARQFTGFVVATTSNNSRDSGAHHEDGDCSSASSLRELNFSFTYIDDVGLCSILKLCSSSLKILRLQGPTHSITSDGLGKAFRHDDENHNNNNNNIEKNSSFLQELHIDSIASLKTLEFLKEEVGFQSLKKLTLSQLNLSVVEFQHGSHSFSFLSALSQLEELNLSACIIIARSSKDSDDISQWTRNGSHRESLSSSPLIHSLKKLDLCQCSRPTTVVRSLAEFSNLEYLDVRHLYNEKDFTAKDLEFVVEKLPRLTSLLVCLDMWNDIEKTPGCKKRLDFVKFW